MKTLEDAIGCWTTSEDGMHDRGEMIVQSIRAVKRQTKRNNTDRLFEELHLLHRRLTSTLELTNDAMRRLHIIVVSKELEK